MAKTIKSTKRSTPVKKTRFKINFNSKRTQFITVIVLVAIMGAGWFTYRSFALSTYAATAKVFEQQVPTVIENKTNTGKNGQLVARIAPGKTIGWSHQNRQNGKYRLCVTLRYEAPSASSRPAQLKLIGIRNQFRSDQRTFSDTIFATSAVSYTKQCGRSIELSGLQSITMNLRNDGPSTVRLYRFSLEELQPAL